MDTKLVQHVAVVASLMLLTSTGSVLAADSSVATPKLHYISANVPLSSYVYDYLEKLDGLGYMQDMRPGTKPYTRMQVAQWLSQIDGSLASSDTVPPFARRMVQELHTDFAKELAVLAGNTAPSAFALKEVRLAETYYDGKQLAERRTASVYQPLNINNNGVKYSPYLNHSLSLQAETAFAKQFIYSVTPQLTANTDKSSATLDSGYVKASFLHNYEVQFGKDALWWGQGERGSLLLTNNAKPQTGLKFSTLNPVNPPKFLKFVGPSTTTVFYSILESNRNDVKYPSLFGVRTEFLPAQNFSFAGALASLVGGQGHMLHGGDYWNFINGTNAKTRAADKWDDIAYFSAAEPQS